MEKCHEGYPLPPNLGDAQLKQGHVTEQFPRILYGTVRQHGQAQSIIYSIMTRKFRTIWAPFLLWIITVLNHAQSSD
jgi:hypothetical protein